MDIWAQRLYYQSGRSLRIYFASLSCTPCCASVFPLPYSFTMSALLYQSHRFCCALKQSHKLTCWILNWDIKPWGASIQRELFYILSLWKLFMFVTRCSRWISSQRTNVPRLCYQAAGKKPFPLETDRRMRTDFNHIQIKLKWKTLCQHTYHFFCNCLWCNHTDKDSNTNGLMIAYKQKRDYRFMTLYPRLYFPFKHQFYYWHHTCPYITAAHLPPTLL